MTREWKIRMVTALVLLAALGAGVARKAGWRLADLRPARAAAASQDPQSAIYAMLNAARTGDVKSYLASYTGQMEASLRQMLAESNERDFAKYLRDSNSALKGVAVSDPRVTGQTAAVRVEYVYQDRNEVQTLYLEKGTAGWKIVRADGDERIPTLIPYGTPVK